MSAATCHQEQTAEPTSTNFCTHARQQRMAMLNESCNVLNLHFQSKRFESCTLGSSYVNIAIHSSLNIAFVAVLKETVDYTITKISRGVRLDIFMQPRSSHQFDNVTLTQQNVHVKLEGLFDRSNSLTPFLWSSTVLCNEALCMYVFMKCHCEQTARPRSINLRKHSRRKINYVVYVR